MLFEGVCDQDMPLINGCELEGEDGASKEDKGYGQIESGDGG